MRNATHQEAVAALIANVSLIKLLVRHDPPPKGLQVRQSIGNRSFRPNVNSPEVVSPGRKSIRETTSGETTTIHSIFFFTWFLSRFFDKPAVKEQFDKKSCVFFRLSTLFCEYMYSCYLLKGVLPADLCL